MKRFRHVMSAVLMIAMVLTMALPVYASESTERTAAQVKVITPSAKAASYSYSKIKVTWDKIDGLDGYIVYRAASKDGKFTRTFTTTKTSYINTGRMTGKYYYYKVRGYKKMNGKTVYTKYSPITATCARPNRVKINEVYGTPKGLGVTTLDWKSVEGASGYECQVNRKKDGKWTGWRSYVYNEDGRRESFDTYDSLLASEKKKYPDGYVTTLVDGKVKTLTLEEDLARNITKTQAWIDIVDDSSIYKFRVRAYRTVTGKKVYGAWSDEYTLKETLNSDEILAALRQYTIDYAARNHPEFKYDDDNIGQTPENSGYYVQGAFAGFSMYAREEDVIEAYKETIARYVDRMKTSGGEKSGFLYIRKSYPGDIEGISGNNSVKTYYAIWMLY
ncbi:MAG: hypothetical protein ACI4WY_00425 [Anaerovoracaceae bacterium]